MEAKVDSSLGNIRENIRKSANQKHVSTSMVDPLKAMKKSGKLVFYRTCSKVFRSKRPRLEANSPVEVLGRAGQSKRDEIEPVVVKCKISVTVNRDEIRLVGPLWRRRQPFSVLMVKKRPTCSDFRHKLSSFKKVQKSEFRNEKWMTTYSMSRAKTSHQMPSPR